MSAGRQRVSLPAAMFCIAERPDFPLAAVKHHNINDLAAPNQPPREHGLHIPVTQQ
jgi:hypothetical protein